MPSRTFPIAAVLLLAMLAGCAHTKKPDGPTGFEKSDTHLAQAKENLFAVVNSTKEPETKVRAQAAMGHLDGVSKGIDEQ